MKADLKWLPLGLVLVLWMVGTALAAMSDAKALSEAQRLFGVMGGITTQRGRTDTYWGKGVGVYTPGCRDTFKVLGGGSNTWEAAFKAVNYNTAVSGAISGMVTLRAALHDSDGVASFQFLLDGKPLGPETKFPADSQIVMANLEYATANGPQGLHVVCGVGKDSLGNAARMPGFLVEINQQVQGDGNLLFFLGGSNPQFTEAIDFSIP